MSLSKILLLTDQQLNCGSSPIDNMKSIESEYAALTIEEKDKYNEMVGDMLRGKYSNAARNRVSGYGSTAIDIAPHVNGDPNLHPSVMRFYEILTKILILMGNMIYATFCFVSIRILVNDGVSVLALSIYIALLVILYFWCVV
jgi:hypothetical protein